MSVRRFVLPLSSLNLFATTGCTDVSVGDWVMTELIIDGEEYQLTYTDDGYTYELQGEFSVEDDGEAKFKITQIYSGEGYFQTYSYTWEGEWQLASRGEISVELEGQSDGMGDLELDCTVDDEELECEGEESTMGDMDVLFERDE